MAVDLFINGTVHTMDDARPVVRALAIADGRVLAVGSHDALAAAHPTARRHDLAGATVLPGLIDSHLHLLSVGLNAAGVDLSDARSVADVLDALRDRVRATEAGGWVRTSSRWHESGLHERRFPTRQELDTVAPEHPVLVRRGGHNVVANTAALQAAGIGNETADPHGGTYVRDADGNLTGHIIGAPAYGRVVRLLPQPDEAVMLAAIRSAATRALAFGITGVIEPGLTDTEIAAYHAAHAAGALPLRTVLMPRLAPGTTPEERERALTQYYRLSAPTDGDWLKVGGVKIVADGGVETNYLRRPYAHTDDQSAPHGKPHVSLENLTAVCLAAARDGRQLGVHCVGDAAIDLVLDAFTAADRVHSIAALRWTLIHATLAQPEHLERARTLGLSLAVQQPLVDALGAGWLKYWGAERAALASPLRRYADSGLPVGAGSDAPVTDLDPWRALWSAATRHTAHAGVLGADQAVDAATMLRWYTHGSAALSLDEGRRGTLAPGMLADFIVVSPDPLRISATRLREVQVRATYVGGIRTVTD